jgi:leucyl-tRNA synthetase
VLQITAYAEKLLKGLESLDWPDSTKEMQRNWIGRSEGAEIEFAIDDLPGQTIRVFTTRPDTLFGATYMVLAPEHPLVESITSPAQSAALREYCERAARKSDFERAELQKTKTGVFTGAFVTNPATQRRIPIWVADYVLASYGTGAIMAVPGQDQRDWDFAAAYDLPIVRTVKPPADFAGEAYLGDGPAMNSGFLDGLSVDEAKRRIIAWLEAQGHGRSKVNFKLRDWLFSRQRYWGEPFPILFVDGEPHSVPDDDLPIELPALAEFKPSGSPEGPLATARDWLETIDPRSGRPARRETNTMPQWAGSCWYYLRYIDPANSARLVNEELENYWMPVDLYVGGSEHAVLHLLYARFWHKLLYDIGIASTPEPFKKLVHQGMILGELEFTEYRDAAGRPVSAEQVRDGAQVQSGAAVESLRIDDDAVEKLGEHFVLRSDSTVRVEARAYKMSKSRGNVVNPDDIVATYGADAFRLYEMFLGPLEQVKPWNTRGVEGTHRFLNRVWRMIAGSGGGELSPAISDTEPSREQLFVLNRTLAKVTEDIEALRFNTAIAALMEFSNAAGRWRELPRAIAESFVLMLSPLAPHIGEELWRRLGHEESLATAPWPRIDETYLIRDTIEVPVQVNGKVRGRIEIPAEATEEQVLTLAKQDQNVARYLGNGDIKRAIYVRQRIVNFVVSN